MRLKKYIAFGSGFASPIMTLEEARGFAKEKLGKRLARRDQVVENVHIAEVTEVVRLECAEPVMIISLYHPPGEVTHGDRVMARQRAQEVDDGKHISLTGALNKSLTGMYADGIIDD